MKIELLYFKPHGKYYSTGELEINEAPMYSVIDYVKRLKEEKKLPGLIEGHSDFHVVITGNGHPRGFPALLLGKLDETSI